MWACLLRCQIYHYDYKSILHFWKSLGLSYHLSFSWSVYRATHDSIKPYIIIVGAFLEKKFLGPRHSVTLLKSESLPSPVRVRRGESGRETCELDIETHGRKEVIMT